MAQTVNITGFGKGEKINICEMKLGLGKFLRGGQICKAEEGDMERC